MIFYNIYKRYQSNKNIPGQKYGLIFRISLPLIGFLALLWFLIRVIPKPSRATYPCQRIAFPLASSFIIWLMGLVGALSFLKRARVHLNKKKILGGLACLLISILILWGCLTVTSQKKVLAAAPVSNQPVGIGKGIYPGRVVWVHDPAATDWDGPDAGDGYSWEPENTPQKYVDAMVSKAVRELTGQSNDSDAWDALFRYFNQQHGKGDVGYTPGEKITIKANLVTCNKDVGAVNTETYEKTDLLNNSDTSPQMIVAVLRQLVNKAGVSPSDIAVGDTLCHFPNQWWNICHAEFPEVTFFDCLGEQGRFKSPNSTIQQYWSEVTYPNDSYTTDYIPAIYAEASYLINMAELKGHAAGITLCAKNHYGSYSRIPGESGYYDLHNSIAGTNYNPADGQYRAMVDIIGHPHMGGKTLLYLVDGLYGGYYWNAAPYQFQTAPFNDDWPSSLLLSQDPVAIDSVGLDILWEEWPNVVQIGGVDDYLFEAALADNPPSGTFYDPDGDGVGLPSLGVHERWNNSTDRQYSRNLGTGNGIELRYILLEHHAGDLNDDNFVGIMDLAELIEHWLWAGNPGDILEDMVEDGVVDMQDFGVIAENWDKSY